MTSGMRYRLAWLTLAWAWVQLPAQATSLHLTAESTPPSIVLKDGRVAGSATDKIRAMMARAGVTVDIDLLPWQRAYSLAQIKGDTCVYQTTRTAEREALFKWVGPISTTDWTLYGLAQRDLHLTTLEDARPYKIGGYLGDASDQYLRARGFRVESVANDALNPQKLLGKRVDLWAATPPRLKRQMAQLPGGDQIVPLLTYNKVGLYLACNVAVPTALVDKLNAILVQMRQDGTSKAIEDQYATMSGP